MEVKISMSYLEDKKYKVKNTSGNELVAVSYTHLTLPTICSV